jgi:hypothetical protein
MAPPIKYQPDRETGVDILLGQVGSVTRIARVCGITRHAVSHWRRVPVAHVLKLEAAFGVPRYELRPDIYPPPATRRRVAT